MRRKNDKQHCITAICYANSLRSGRRIRLRPNPRVIYTGGAYPKNIKFNPVTAVILNVGNNLNIRNLSEQNE